MGATQQMLIAKAAAGGGSYQAETTYWANGIVSAGGTVITADKDLLDAHIVQMKTRSYYTKIKAYWPMLGPSIICHRMPAIDTLTKGIATNSGFTDSDCDTTTGMVNTGGAAKILNSLYKPQDLGATTTVGGMFVFAKTWANSSAVEPIGCYNSGDSNNRCVIDLRSNLRAGRFSSVTGASDTTAATAGFYLSQRASASSMKIYKDGSLLNHNTTLVGVAANSAEIRIGGAIDHTGALTYGQITMVGAGVIDGTFSDAEVTDLNTDLVAFNTACGR